RRRPHRRLRADSASRERNHLQRGLQPHGAGALAGRRHHPAGNRQLDAPRRGSLSRIRSGAARAAAVPRAAAAFSCPRPLPPSTPQGPFPGGSADMLMTIFIALVVLWLIAVVLGQSFGGLIHLLLLLAIIVLVTRVIRRGRR